MPLYEYECKQCGKHTEKRQKFSDPEITECPFCNGPLERVISAPNISFKGGGWYKDLYSSSKPAGSAAGSANAESSSGGSDGASGGSPDGSSSSSANAGSGAAAASSTPAAAAPAASAGTASKP